jgi:hypothetical protein
MSSRKKYIVQKMLTCSFKAYSESVKLNTLCTEHRYIHLSVQLLSLIRVQL